MKEEEAASDLESSVGSSQGTSLSDETTTNRSVETTSICLQSSAETVAERMMATAGTEGAELDGSVTPSAARKQNNPEGEDSGVSEDLTDLALEEPPANLESSGKEGEGTEDSQERAYQALL